MKTLGYYNGVINDLEHSMVPMLDRGCYFGDGIFNVAYCRNYKIFALDYHIDQFFESAKLLHITPGFSKRELYQLLSELVLKLDIGNLWVYFQLTRGTAIRMHAFPDKSVKPNLWVMIRPGEIQNINKKIKCITVKDNRFNYCNIKTLNYIPNVLAAQQTVEQQADECIMVRDGIVTECAHSNLCILKNGIVFTHPADEHIYAGVGRKILFEECKGSGIPFVEKQFSVDEMLAADEIFRISGSSLCMQVIEIDGKKVGQKDEKVLKRLQNLLLSRYLRETE